MSWRYWMAIPLLMTPGMHLYAQRAMPADSSRQNNRSIGNQAGAKQGSSADNGGHSLIDPNSKPSFGNELEKNANRSVKAPFKYRSKVKKENLSFDLSLSGRSLYQPGLLSGGPGSNSKWATIGEVTGIVKAFGIPINVNYSTNRALSNRFYALNNGLFKFDFNPNQLKKLLQNDLERYSNFRKDVLGGRDLTSYAAGVAKSELPDPNSVTLTPGIAALAKYLQSGQNINKLLNLNEPQMREKLQSVVKERAKAVSDSLGRSGEQTTFSGNLNKPADARSLAVEHFKQDTLLAAFLSRPGIADSLKKLDPKEIKNLLMANSSVIARRDTSHYLQKLVFPTPVSGGLNSGLTSYINRVIQQNQHQSAEDVLAAVAAGLSQRKKKPLSYQDLLATQQPASAGQQDPLLFARGDATVSGEEAQRIAAVAASLSQLKRQLQERGLDINRTLQLQNYVNNGTDHKHLSELENSFYDSRPRGLQGLLNNVSDFKVGSFGERAAGNTQNQDLFMTGTHVTIKASGIPFTVGFGSVNDLASFKDAGYQSSVYNSPRSISYLGADINQGPLGHVKVSVIGSVNRGITGSNYALPTISSNNVVFTLSKSINMGGAGNLSFDASKSSTLFSNKYQIENNALLDRKNGLSYGNGADFFEALAMGVNHHVDVPELNLSESAYFNYSSSGYQNPGNNGPGGGRLKLGWNVRESFDNNKFTLLMRTDINQMPISYTTNDRWSSFQVQMDGRYVVSRKFNFDLKFTGNSTDKMVAGNSASVYSFQQFQFSGNTNYKIGKNISVSHFSIGVQDIRNSYVATTAGNMLIINYIQSLVLKKNTLSASVFYNKEFASYQMIGNMLNSELSYQYSLWSGVSLSSGLTYLENSGIAKQIGARQTLQLYSTRNWDVSTYCDIRKNLINPIYPDLYSACRAELSLKYHIRN